MGCSSKDAFCFIEHRERERLIKPNASGVRERRQFFWELGSAFAIAAALESFKGWGGEGGGGSQKNKLIHAIFFNQEMLLQQLQTQKKR